MPAAGDPVSPARPVRRIAGVDVTEALRLTGIADLEPGGGDEVAALQRVVDELCALSSQDGLTGLANRRAFRNALERELERGTRSGEVFGLLLIDIDHFKRVNDTYGHLAGDRVLCAVAKLLDDSFRPMDTVARFGGEEFAVILPNSSLVYSRQVAERVNARIAQQPVLLAPGVEISITTSVGVACASAWTAHDADTLVAAADHNLYQAKHQGRNRVFWEPQPSSALTSVERALLFAVAD